MVKKIGFTALFMGRLFTCFSQTAQGDTVPTNPKPVFTASADVYFRHSLEGGAANNKTSFTNSDNSFELGMASVKMEHSRRSMGMTADIGFGRRAEEFSYADDQTRFIIKQLFLNYSFKNGIKLTAGSWATHVGYELVDAYSNRNYSMSYLFSYGPFFHTGLKAEKSFGKTGLMLGIANPTDLKSATGFGGSKYAIGQISTATDDGKTKIWLNFQGGKSSDSTRVGQLDAVVTTAIGSKFNLGLNGSTFVFQSRSGAENGFGDAKNWWAAAAYLNADPFAWLGLTLRTEYFSDRDQLNVFGAQPSGGGVFANTLSANFKKESLTVIPEIRFEKASDPLFFDGDGAATDASFSFLLAAFYKF